MWDLQSLLSLFCCPLGWLVHLSLCVCLCVCSCICAKLLIQLAKWGHFSGIWGYFGPHEPVWGWRLGLKVGFRFANKKMQHFQPIVLFSRTSFSCFSGKRSNKQNTESNCCRLFYITPGVGLWGLFSRHFLSHSEIGNEKAAEDALIIRAAQGFSQCSGIALPFRALHVRVLGVVMLNVADSNAHADGSAEMASVSKVPLAAWERKAAANASERSRIQINFPWCLLGSRRLENTHPYLTISA